MRRRRFLVGFALTMAAAAPGCGTRGASRRFGLGRGVPGPMDAEGATIGRDLGRMPAGRTIPPTGLGVDLVDCRPGAEARDGLLDASIQPASGVRLGERRTGDAEGR